MTTAAEWLVQAATLSAPIEGGLSAADIHRVLLSVAAGNATGLEGAAPVFKAQNGTTTRVGGTYTAGTRTITTVNGA